MRFVLEQHLREPAAKILAVVPAEQALQVIGADQTEIPLPDLRRLRQDRVVDPPRPFLDFGSRVEQDEEPGLPLQVRAGCVEE